MIQTRLKGMGVALITPFNEDGSVDYGALLRLVDYQLQNGTDFLCVLGTTAETPTLTKEEKEKVKRTVIDRVNGRIPILLGVGSNSTQAVVESVKNDDMTGVDALLVVVPYYNKPSQTGMIEHFSAIAESVNLPIILYNIPSRTGVNMSIDTVKTLARKYENIVGIKQSFGDMDAITELRAFCPNDFVIYSGDDSLTLPMLSLGAHGVISVASHLFGKEIKSMIRNFKTGDAMTAKNMHLKLYPIFKKLFMAPNPVPVKAALAYKGLIEDYVRRPLVELTKAEKTELFFVLDSI